MDPPFSQVMPVSRVWSCATLEEGAQQVALEAASAERALLVAEEEALLKELQAGSRVELSALRDRCVKIIPTIF